MPNEIFINRENQSDCGMASWVAVRADCQWRWNWKWVWGCIRQVSSEKFSTCANWTHVTKFANKFHKLRNFPRIRNANEMRAIVDKPRPRGAKVENGNGEMQMANENANVDGDGNANANAKLNLKSQSKSNSKPKSRPKPKFNSKSNSQSQSTSQSTSKSQLALQATKLRQARLHFLWGDSTKLFSKAFQFRQQYA